MNIVKGRQARPIRAIVYGTEGIGKTTLASRFPAPLFVDVEGGTLRLDVDRTEPLSWSAVGAVVDELTKSHNGYQTLVFDTADWLDRMASQHVCAANGWAKGIETPGYGKGHVAVGEAWKGLLDQLSHMQERTGLNVVFLAHAVMRKQELPDEAGQFDRWEMKTSKYVCPLLKEWADLVLFLNYKTLVVTTDNGKGKAQGGQRVMYTTHHPCWDAKNRFGLKEELPLDFAALAPVFAALPAAPAPMAAATPAVTAQVTIPDAETPADLKPVPVAERVEDPEKKALLRQLGQLMVETKVSKEELGTELARVGAVPADMNPRDYNVQTLKRIVSAWTTITKNIATTNAAKKAT